MSEILGLDLGTNSIGWAIIDGSSNKIGYSGVRLSPSSLNNERRLAKQQHRVENRFAQRVLKFYEQIISSKKENSIILTLGLFSTGLLTIGNFGSIHF